jgi:CheY-like chemotaxis protein
VSEPVPHVLVVDDDGAAARLLAEVLAREGYRVTTAQSVAEAVATLEAGARYDATEIMQGVTEVLAYGTAVFVEPVSR